MAAKKRDPLPRALAGRARAPPAADPDTPGLYTGPGAVPTAAALDAGDPEEDGGGGEGGADGPAVRLPAGVSRLGPEENGKRKRGGERLIKRVPFRW